MFRKRVLGACLCVLLPLAAAGQDKSKKTYELIYQDVQLLMQQVQELRDEVNRNAERILTLGNELKSISEILRQSISDQGRIREDIRGIPSQYRDLLARIDQVNLQLQKVTTDLEMFRTMVIAAPEEEESSEGTPPEKTGQTTDTEGEEPEEKTDPAATKPPPVTNISPEEAYRMAYNDYLQGRFDLAIDSFKLYKDQFPASPLADNAFYWIGECHFSERRFEEAIDAFNELILTYPQGDKVPAAFLKKGFSYMELGKNDEALAAFKILTTKYPLEEETKIALGKIKELTDK